MSKLRPYGLCDAASNQKALSDDTALFLIRDAVAKRKMLIHGHLHAGGEHCAIGAFFNDHPRAILNSALIDEVASVNDSVPPSASPKLRWKKVNEWLRFKLATIRNGGR